MFIIVAVVCGRSVFGPSFCYAVLSVFSSFAIILMEKKERVVCFTLNVFLMACDC